MTKIISHGIVDGNMVVTTSEKTIIIIKQDFDNTVSLDDTDLGLKIIDGIPIRFDIERNTLCLGRGKPPPVEPEPTICQHCDGEGYM